MPYETRSRKHQNRSLAPPTIQSNPYSFVEKLPLVIGAKTSIATGPLNYENLSRYDGESTKHMIIIMMIVIIIITIVIIIIIIIIIIIKIMIK